MIKNIGRIIPLIIISFFIVNLSGCIKEEQEGPGENWENGELKNAYETLQNLRAAVKNGNKEEAIKFISKKKLVEVEKSGKLDELLNYLSGLEINYGKRRGSVVTLKEEKNYGLEGKGYSSTMTVYMINKNNEWKVATEDVIK